MRLILAVPLVALLSCSTTTSRLHLPPLQTVPRVELSRYVGDWYEIAHFAEFFQRGCVATQAHYTVREDGMVDVLNTCRKGNMDGDVKVAHGVARVVDPQSYAKLQVSFFRPFWGDYWVIDLDPDYRYAVVGHPSRDHLWILSRTPELPQATYDAIVRRLQAQDYDTSRLQVTHQPTLPPG